MNYEEEGLEGICFSLTKERNHLDYKCHLQLHYKRILDTKVF
jgi:hypothetical protein